MDRYLVAWLALMEETERVKKMFPHNWPEKEDM
jgi:hypothetical protein